MSAPMSVKERIAMMKQKEDEEKASKAKLPDPPVRRSSLTDKSNITNAHGNVNNTAGNAVAPPTTSPDATCGAAEETVQKVSIADKIAALKASNAPVRTFQPPTQNPASSSSPDVSSSSMVGERMAALRRKSVGSTDAPVPPAPPAEGSASADKDGSSDVVSAAPKSVAERMAALRASSAPVPVVPVKSSPAPSLAAVFPPPPASPAEAVATSDATITPPKMTIAERMAALKASAAEHPTTPSDAVTNSSNGTPLSTGGRRVSVGLVGLGAKINLAALSPNAVRPPVKREVQPETEAAAEKETTGEDGSVSPKSNRVSFNAQENGEFRHLSLSRPAVHSIRRKNTTASVRLSSSAWESGEGFSDSFSLTSSAPGTPSTLNSANSSRPVSFAAKGNLDVVPDVDEGERAEEPEDPKKEEESEHKAEPDSPVSHPPPPPRRASVLGTPPPPPPPVPAAEPNSASSTVSMSPPMEEPKVTAPPPPPAPVVGSSAVPASPPQEPKVAMPPPPPPVAAQCPPVTPEAEEPATAPNDAAPSLPPPPPPHNSSTGVTVRRVSVHAPPPPPPPPAAAEVFESTMNSTDGALETNLQSHAHPPPPPPPQPLNVSEEGHTLPESEETQDTRPLTPSKSDLRKDPRFSLL